MSWWHRVADRRPPDFVVGGKDTPYMRRWFLVPRNGFFNVYLHQFLRSDDDRALHDHPFLMNLSIILEGSYVEHTIAQGGCHRQRTYARGAWRLRGPWLAHRIEVDASAWTLFITGPRVREWGFHCPQGWRRWQEFVDAQPNTLTDHDLAKIVVDAEVDLRALVTYALIKLLEEEPRHE